MSTIEPECGPLASLLSAAEPARLAAALAAACVGGALAVGEPGLSSWRAWAAVALAALFLQAGGRLLSLRVGESRFTVGHVRRGRCRFEQHIEACEH